ncbi:MAG: nuclease [Gammaproteobacteria bacterium]|nr:MAG: nuclease [Gammaproteobacteria bacterium]
MDKNKIMSRYLFTFTSLLTFSANATIIINEIDYDQPGKDNAEFIELFNTDSVTTSLDHYSISLINGSNAKSYRDISLSGFSIAANSFFVVCSDIALVANCNYSFTAKNSWFQNGAPDAVALYKKDTLIDALSYEGTLPPYTQGNVLKVKDNNTDIVSISRFDFQLDNNDNFRDFALGCITPGTTNIAGKGDCSTTVTHAAIPEPGTTWLLGAGLMGLIGLSKNTSEETSK